MEGKITSALTAIQGLGTAVVVGMGIVSACIIASKKLPSIDNPQVKNELINSLLCILAIVALVAASIWAVPWIYGLFQ